MGTPSTSRSLLPNTVWTLRAGMRLPPIEINSPVLPASATKFIHHTYWYPLPTIAPPNPLKIPIGPQSVSTTEYKISSSSTFRRIILLLPQDPNNLRLPLPLTSNTTNITTSSSDNDNDNDNQPPPAPPNYTYVQIPCTMYLHTYNLYQQDQQARVTGALSGSREGIFVEVVPGWAKKGFIAFFVA